VALAHPPPLVAAGVGVARTWKSIGCPAARPSRRAARPPSLFLPHKGGGDATERSSRKLKSRRLHPFSGVLVFSIVPAGFKNRGPLDGLDPFSAGCEHYEPVKAQRGATCVRHIGEGRKEILVDRMGEAENPLLFSHA
jgi:hypothetical protein